MATRTATRPTREANFSAVGQVGRRTGVTLPRGRLDDNGIEEISGIFSSPRKPSPLKQSFVAPETILEKEITPRLTRKSLRGAPAPPPRSASPRKTGINGTARRSQGFELQATDKPVRVIDVEDQENTPEATPSRVSTNTRRFSPSPEKTPVPLRDITTANGPQSTGQIRSVHIPKPITPDPTDEMESEVESEPDKNQSANDDEELADSDEFPPSTIPYDNDAAPLPGDNDYEPSAGSNSETTQTDEPIPSNEFDDEEADATFVPEEPSRGSAGQTSKSSSKRRRTRDDAENSEASYQSPTQRTKRQRIQSASPTPAPEPRANRSKEGTTSNKPAKNKGKERQPLSKKSNNVKLSSQQEKELDDIIEKVKPRPGQKKSLYILRRETPAEDGVMHTRSGRISVKPLAYWKNERCVYGGSPGGASLADGARFPLNSIREIIRVDDVDDSKSTKKKSKTKQKQGRARSKTPKASEHSESSDSDSDGGDGRDDPDAEPWESKRGILSGPVSVWDQGEQLPLEEEEEVDLAYAPAAIVTKEVKPSGSHGDASFKYAKLLSSPFFGTGIVDLPPGGLKRPRNSRKMHMSFFVFKGRVTVEVGPIGGEELGTMNRFSIGKGGFWQVPRGNQYSIENELDKPARIFFSQACESSRGDDD